MCQDSVLYMSACINLIIVGETVFDFFTKKLVFYFVSINLMFFEKRKVVHSLQFV